MSIRAYAEAALLSIGLLACLAASLIWGTSQTADPLAWVREPRLWSAVWASAQIGLAASFAIATATLALAAGLLAREEQPSAWVLALALASALTPDLIHALIWRAALQPGLGWSWAADRAADPALQCVAIGLVLALKWVPIAALVSALAAGARRRRLYRMLRLAQMAQFTALRRAFGGYLARTVVICLSLGVVLGVRQHEISDILLSGGTGFVAEGLSQWSAKVALSFLDPGRAAAQLLLVILGLLAVIGAGALPKRGRRTL